MKKNRLYSTCMCCGLQEKEEYYFYDRNDYGTLAICRCCGCQSGNNDFNLENLLMYRYEWDKGMLHWQNGNPNIWFDDALNDAKPRIWNKQQQMQKIPRHLLINSFPLYSLAPKERSICRICGYEAQGEDLLYDEKGYLREEQEQDFFYDEQGYPKYRYCPCCGGQSGYDDFDTHYIESRHKAWKMFLKTSQGVE